MAHLAVALAQRGNKVVYVVKQEMSKDRARQGWKAPSLAGVKLHLLKEDADVNVLIGAAHSGSVHICQGLRSNGMVGVAQRVIAAHGLRQWAIMETVDDAGFYGVLKRLEYSRIIWSRRAAIQGILATGHRTANWVIERGMPADRVFPFAYFLSDNVSGGISASRGGGGFRFIYVGQLIPRKRVDWLINAFSELKDKTIELWIVGTGPEALALQSLAREKAGNRIRWLGSLPIEEVSAVMAQADCLVLPSRYDGWGAVASEAMMVGTPVICSDTCGVAGVVKASVFGGVFRANDAMEFATMLAKQVELGAVPSVDRKHLALWANALGAKAGANYLNKIIDYTDNKGERPQLPWKSQAI